MENMQDVTKIFDGTGSPRLVIRNRADDGSKKTYVGLKPSKALLEMINVPNEHGMLFTFGEDENGFEPIGVYAFTWNSAVPSFLAGKNFAFVESGLAKKPLRTATTAAAAFFSSFGKEAACFSNPENLAPDELIASAEEAKRAVEAVRGTEFAEVAEPKPALPEEAEEAESPNPLGAAEENAPEDETGRAEEKPNGDGTDETESAEPDGNGTENLPDATENETAEPSPVSETEREEPAEAAEPEAPERGAVELTAKVGKSDLKGAFLHDDGDPYGPFVLKKGSRIDDSETRKNVTAEVAAMRRKAKVLGYLDGTEVVRDCVFPSPYAAIAFGYGLGGTTFRTPEGKNTEVLKKEFDGSGKTSAYKKFKRIRFVSSEETEIARKFGLDPETEIRTWVSNAKCVAVKPAALTTLDPEGILRFFLVKGSEVTPASELGECRDVKSLTVAATGSEGARESWYDVETNQRLCGTRNGYVQAARLMRKKAAGRKKTDGKKTASGATKKEASQAPSDDGAAAPAGRGTEEFASLTAKHDFRQAEKLVFEIKSKGRVGRVRVAVDEKGKARGILLKGSEMPKEGTESADYLERYPKTAEKARSVTGKDGKSTEDAAFDSATEAISAFRGCWSSFIYPYVRDTADGVGNGELRTMRETLITSGYAEGKRAWKGTCSSNGDEITVVVSCGEPDKISASIDGRRAVPLTGIDGTTWKAVFRTASEKGAELVKISGLPGGLTGFVPVVRKNGGTDSEKPTAERGKEPESKPEPSVPKTERKEPERVDPRAYGMPRRMRVTGIKFGKTDHPLNSDAMYELDFLNMDGKGRFLYKFLPKERHGKGFRTNYSYGAIVSVKKTETESVYEAFPNMGDMEIRYCKKKHELKIVKRDPNSVTGREVSDGKHCWIAETIE